MEYEVQEIIDKRIVGGKTQYLIKWKGYGKTANSWEPENNLNCSWLILKYERNQIIRILGKFIIQLIHLNVCNSSSH